MARSVKSDKPFFVWMNFTRMHVWTRLQEKYRGVTGIGLYADGMKELDDMVGGFLDYLKELGVEDNTIVIFSTDNGAEKFSFPDGGASPYRGEKGTAWEGGMRVPMTESAMYMRWYADNMWLMVPDQSNLSRSSS